MIDDRHHDQHGGLTPAPDDDLDDANDDASVDASVDGRTLRRTRNRDAVIDSMLAMIREGDLQPTAASIADRAGVSHRSIFRYFDDLDDLVRATISRAFEEAAPYTVIPDIGVGTLDERIDRYVDARLALYTHIDTTMQVARHKALVAPTIERGMEPLYDFARGQVREHFAVELAALDATEEEQVVDAVVLASNHDTYGVHRRVLGSSDEHLRASWQTALRRLLR